MPHYDTSTGSFLTHYYTWETAIRPCPDALQQVRDTKADVSSIDVLLSGLHAAATCLLMTTFQAGEAGCRWVCSRFV